MDPKDLLTVICIVGLMVVGINGLLILALRRRDPGGEIQLFRQAARAARNPWQQEDETLEELARRVAQLKPEESEEGDQ